MESITVQNIPSEEMDNWQILSEAILRVGAVPSLDDLLGKAIDVWLQQLAPALRWQIAIDLYVSEQVSSGRAAEIAGLNYFVFEEKLAAEGIPFIGAEVETEEELEEKKALAQVRQRP